MSDPSSSPEPAEPRRLYDGDQVDAYLADLHEQLDRALSANEHLELEMAATVGDLQSRLDSSQRDLESAQREVISLRTQLVGPAGESHHLEAAERLLGQAMLQAQRAADLSAAEAELGAQAILADARNTAGSVMARARAEAAALIARAQADIELLALRRTEDVRSQLDASHARIIDAVESLLQAVTARLPDRGAGPTGLAPEHVDGFDGTAAAPQPAYATATPTIDLRLPPADDPTAEQTVGDRRSNADPADEEANPELGADPGARPSTPLLVSQGPALTASGAVRNGATVSTATSLEPGELPAADRLRPRGSNHSESTAGLFVNEGLTTDGAVTDDKRSEAGGHQIWPPRNFLVHHPAPQSDDRSADEVNDISRPTADPWQDDGPGLAVERGAQHIGRILPDGQPDATPVAPGAGSSSPASPTSASIVWESTEHLPAPARPQVDPRAAPPTSDRWPPPLTPPLVADDDSGFAPLRSDPVSGGPNGTSHHR